MDVNTIDRILSHSYRSNTLQYYALRALSFSIVLTIIFNNALNGRIIEHFAVISCKHNAWHTNRLLNIYRLFSTSIEIHLTRWGRSTIENWRFYFHRYEITNSKRISV